MPVFSGQTLTVMQLSDAQRKLGIIPGAFLPADGAAGFFLAKLSAADYDVGWVLAPGPVAGRGIVVVGTTVHFAQAGVYTTYAVPFATGVGTMGFDPANFLYDNTVPHLFLENATLGFGTHDPVDYVHDIIRMERTISTTWHPTGVAAIITRTAPADSAEWGAGGSFDVRTAANAINYASNEALMGVVAQGIHQGTGTCAGITGVRGTAFQDSTGAVNYTWGGRFQVGALNAGGTVNVGVGVIVQAPTVTGTINTYYGVYVSDAPGPVACYGFYQASSTHTQYNYFAANTVIGDPIFVYYVGLRVERDFTSFHHLAAIEGVANNDPGADMADYNIGGLFICRTNGAFDWTYFVDSCMGADCQGIHNGSGTISGITGCRGYAQKTGTGNVTFAYGGRFAVINNNAAGTLGTAIGVMIQSPTNIGTITTYYGLYVQTGAGSTVYGIYQQSTADSNFLGGNTSIGTATFNTTIILRLQRSYVTSAQAVYGVYSDVTNTPVAGNAQTNVGGRFAINTASVNNFTLADLAAIGLRGEVNHGGSGQISGTATGVWGHVSKNSTGAISNAIGVRGVIDNNNGAGAISNAYVFFAASPVVTGAISSWYGVYVQASGVSNGYGVYQTGTSDYNYLGGDTAIGNATFSATVVLRVSRDFAVNGATNTYGQAIVITNTPTLANSGLNIGLSISYTTAGGQNFTYAGEAIMGLDVQAYHNSTGTCTSTYGVRVFAQKKNSGAVTSVFGLRIYTGNTNAAGAITTDYSIFISTPSVTGTVTTHYGLYIQAGAGGTIYGIAQVGTTDLNYFAGFTACGSASPVNTAWLLLGVSTATITSLRIPRGSAAYGGTVEGDFWNDFTQQCLIGYVDGIKQFDVRDVFIQTDDKDVTNTNVETTMFGAGIGTLTFPANFFVVGKTVRVKLVGVLTQPVAGPTWTWRVKLGGVTLATSAAVTHAAETNRVWLLEFLLTCRTTGAGGTVIGQGGVFHYETGGPASVALAELPMAAAAALNTTLARTLDVTLQLSAADAGQHNVTTNATVEVLA